MSPGATETLFALGLGDRVVGVTKFCTAPPEAMTRTSIGGFLDPNLETIVSLAPDLVVVMESHAEVEGRLTGLGLDTLRVDQHDVASILDSFVVLARACGVPERGARLRSSVAGGLERIERVVAAKPRPRTLVVVGRSAGSGSIRSLWAAAPGTFFDDVLTLAGGRNALADRRLGSYPEISREGLMSIDPEVILDVIPDLSERGLEVDAAGRDWLDLEALGAVREGRVFILAEPYMSVPGPRLVSVVETVARVLHPEVAP